jgi:Flp pilus assembly protein TadG
MGTRSQKRQRGMTLVWVALLLFIFVAIAAIAIDVGMAYTARNSAQNAADAAALAGAYTFTNPSAAEPDDAQNAAIRVAAQNKVMGNAVTITAGDVQVDTTTQRVTVTVSRLGTSGVVAFFSKIFGYSNLGVVAKATAEAGVGTSSPQGTASHCLKPIFIPNTVLASNDTNNVSVQKACNDGHVIFNSASGPDAGAAPGSVTAWANSQFDNGKFPQVIIRNGDPKAAATDVAPSQYYSLDFGSGASTYRCALGQCLNNCGVPDLITCSDTVNSLVTENGRMTQPTIQGIDNMIQWPNGNTDQWCSSTGCSSPTQFLLGDGTIGADSRSLGAAAIWNNCANYGGSLIGPGKTSMPVLGFVEMFIDGVTQQSSGSTGTAMAAVSAHIVRKISCSQVDSGGPPPPAGSMTIPIRLVQNPTQ